MLARLVTEPRPVRMSFHLFLGQAYDLARLEPNAVKPPI